MRRRGITEHEENRRCPRGTVALLSVSGVLLLQCGPKAVSGEGCNSATKPPLDPTQSTSHLAFAPVFTFLFIESIQ